MERTFILTLDEQQYRDVITAVETFNRIICGQVEELNAVGLPHIDDDTLRQLKAEMFPELSANEFYGWEGGHPNERIDRLQAATYAIYREMRYRLAINDNNKPWSVYVSPTPGTDKARLPKIEITTK